MKIGWPCMYADTLAHIDSQPLYGRNYVPGGSYSRQPKTTKKGGFRHLLISTRKVLFMVDLYVGATVNVICVCLMDAFIEGNARKCALFHLLAHYTLALAGFSVHSCPMWSICVHNKVLASREVRAQRWPNPHPLPHPFHPTLQYASTTKSYIIIINPSTNLCHTGNKNNNPR